MGKDFVRPLFTLAPNRYGLFLNDRECGVVTCGSNFIVGGHLGEAFADRNVVSQLPMLMYSIFLAQSIPSEQVTGNALETGNEKSATPNASEQGLAILANHW